MYALVLLIAVPGQFVDDADISRSVQKSALEASVHIVHKGTTLRGRGDGTGVVIGRKDQVTYILTAEHILPREDDGPSIGMELSFYTATSYPEESMCVHLEGLKASAAVTARDPDLDLALIEVAQPVEAGVLHVCPKTKEALKGITLLHTEKPPIPVLTVGYDGTRGRLTLVPDVVRYVRTSVKPGTRTKMYEADRVPMQGRSGGPLVDKRGYLIGICSGTQSQKGYYVYVEEIHKFLEGNGMAFLIGNGERPANK